MRRRLVPVQGEGQVLQSSQEEQLPPRTRGGTERAPGNADQIKRVAETMFASMCAGFEKDVVTEENMDVAMQNLSKAYLNPTRSLVQTQDYALSSQNIKSYIKKMLQEAIKYGTSKEVTFEAFCEIALRYSEGNISLFDLLDGGDALDTEGKPDRANLETLLYHPVHTLKLLKRDTLRSVERRGVKWLWSTFTTKQMYWLLAVYFLPMMTLQVVVSSLSTALFNGAIVFMVLVTMQIAINSEKLQSRIEYLSLFQCFNREGAQIQPLLPKRDAVHYLTFMLGLIMAVITLGFSNHSFIYYEILVIVAVVASFLIVMEFDLYESPLFWFFFFAKSPSWLVVGAEKFCSLFSLSRPGLLVSLREPLWTSVLFNDFTFEVSPLSTIQVFLHASLIVTQLRHVSWKTFLSELGPLLLFSCWFVLSRYFVVHSSAFHLAVMSTAIVLFPFTTFSFLVSPFLFLYWYGFTAPFFYSVASVVIVSVFSTFIAISFKHRRSWWLNLSIEYIILGLFVVLFGVVLFLSAWYGSVFQVTSPLPQVSLEEYKDYCGSQNWIDRNMVQTQINCMHLQGRVLSTRGEIQSVQISEIVDTRANSLKLFPYFLQRAITCHLGHYTPMCGDRTDMSTCVYNGCHFQHVLTYTFEIKLMIPVDDGGESMKATLLVSNHHKEFMMNLKSGMSLHFNATFVDGMGSDHLTLRAVFLDVTGLDDTRSLEIERQEEIKMGMLSTLVQSIKHSIVIVLEIFFGYILQYN